ncbi:MAG: (2Fe-2S)-binding protein [Aestuariibacter sp.]
MFTRKTNNDEKTVTVIINGEPVEARATDTVAAAILNSGIRTTRTTPVSDSPRGPFCLMGVCFECLVTINGEFNQRACMTTVEPGMEIKSQIGAGMIR